MRKSDNRRSVSLLRTAASIYVSTVPTMVVLGFLFAYAALHYLQWEPGGGWSLVFGVAGIAAMAILLMCVLVVTGRASLGGASASVLSTLVAFSVGIAGSEWLFPVSTPVARTLSTTTSSFTDLQANLQRLLRRRNVHEPRKFRGESHLAAFGPLGWPRPDIEYPVAESVVFVGDSFLEVRSRENLAVRVSNELVDAIPAPTQIINLSEGATSPIDYRFRVNELAVAYRPKAVVVFVYAGNDLLPEYHPYSHPDYFVTSAALQLHRSFGDVDPETIQALELAKRNGKRLASRMALMAVLTEDDRSNQQTAEYLYTSTLAFSVSPAEQRIELGWLPSTVARLTEIFRSAGWLKASTVSGWKKLQREFEEIRFLPEAQQKTKVAQLAATYAGVDSHLPFLRALEGVEAGWWRFVSEEPDMSYFLWPAIEKKVLDRPKFGVSKRWVEKLTDSTFKYLLDIANDCKANGVRVAFVIIPEASQVDSEFNRFWSPLVDFRQWKATEHAATLLLAERLTNLAPTLDLSRGKLDGAYWSMDGHWNEQGNTVVAAMVSRFLIESGLLSDLADE